VLFLYAVSGVKKTILHINEPKYYVVGCCGPESPGSLLH